ncbi:pseudouridine synthase [Winogradskyella echinorum]|uniref:Pseudouridine synthase n=1 Tax=Winogradskyella echinorum TaxID=538189 RepID=A0ABR6Y0W0_9FLAO|nr:pseudouridine synthase [Winogradskyella echinorum]MBC3846381.1 pseudouridine synthase [Winogradskyella echinorum]MBC5750729.1 pseudouridine synthase [Winogradskyella echinorum]
MLYNILVVKQQYYKIYKPYGYLSQFVNHQNKRRNKKLLSELYDLSVNVMAVGRLDEKSEGLLLLTTDGKFSNYITSSKIEKEYHVMVDGLITDEAILKLQSGVEISVNSKPYITKRCDVKIIRNTSHIIDRFVRDERHGKTSWLSIIITEGKFRQVRKMTAKVGFPTLRLVRVRIGDYKLDTMEPSNILPINY